MTLPFPQNQLIYPLDPKAQQPGETAQQFADRMGNVLQVGTVWVRRDDKVINPGSQAPLGG